MGPADLASTNLDQLANSSLFQQWRPTYHFIAPNSWMNDPCGPVYDPSRDMYHLHYQWHPQHINWGNISWGHAQSRDMIYWEDVPTWQGYAPQSLAPRGNGTYDGLGVFTGGQQFVSLNGTTDGTLTIIYTSVQHLPTGWSQYYIPESEQQSIATSTDGGVTWQRYSGNPVILHPPSEYNQTAWRDPFFFQWDYMDRLLYNQSQGNWYLVIGSGTKGFNGT